MDILSQRQPTAKKNHYCDFCGLLILKGLKYDYSVVKGDDFYIWKNHISCQKLASELDMFDDMDEGLTGETFRENVRESYSFIMSEKYSDIYESKDFEIPDFKDMIEFVKQENSIQP